MKLKSPNPNLQAPEKLQLPSVKALELAAAVLLRFRDWSFLGAWSLEFGAF
jgi:hypothetical protein